MRSISAVLVVVLLSTSCLIGKYSRSYYGEPKGHVEGDTRQVPVGYRYELAAVPGTDLELRVKSRKLCRPAVFGTNVLMREWYGSPRYTFAGAMAFAGAMGLVAGMLLIAGGVVDAGNATTDLAIFAPAAYLLAAGAYDIKTMDSERGADVVGHAPNASDWNGTLAECPGIEAVPTAGRKAHIVATFADTGREYSIDLTSDDAGTIRWKSGLAIAARVGAMCGAATLTATDVTDAAPPDAPAPGGVDTGTPTAIRQHVVPFDPVTLSVSPAGTATFDGLDSGALVVAKSCYRHQVSDCIKDEKPGVTPACEETCARTSNTLDCLFRWRKDLLAVGDDPKMGKQVALVRRECQVKLGASPEDEGSCVESCIAREAAARCK